MHDVGGSAVITSSLQPLRPAEFDFNAARRLLSRAGFAGTPAQVRALQTMGLDDAVDYLLEFGEVEYEPVEADRFDRTIMSPLSDMERIQLRRARQQGDEAFVERYRLERHRRQRADRQQMRSIQQWWLARMIETPRPLEERMTLFFHGHFATGYRAIEDSYHMFQQNQLFRRHAVGNFKELTHRIIRDPAMLEYLNNNQNRRQSPNENLARELMELFTLGEGNAYTEDDIKEAARALTGYTFQDDAFVGLDSQTFRRMHDTGVKRILGRSGRFNGDDLVDLIFSKRTVSEHICLKLYRYFVHDLPNGPDESRKAFIVRLAREFRDARYELKPVLRTLFRSEHFYDPSNVGAQIKSPAQLTVQAIRSLRTPTRDLQLLLSGLEMMGQTLFQPPSVEGWEGGRSWINTSTLFVRQNVLVYLLTGHKPETPLGARDGETYDASHLVEHLAAEGTTSDPTEAATYLLRFCLATEPLPKRVEAIRSFIDDCGGRLTNDVVVGALSLITAMPEYQLC